MYRRVRTNSEVLALFCSCAHARSLWRTVGIRPDIGVAAFQGAESHNAIRPRDRHPVLAQVLLTTGGARLPHGIAPLGGRAKVQGMQEEQSCDRDDEDACHERDDGRGAPQEVAAGYYQQPRPRPSAGSRPQTTMHFLSQQRARSVPIMKRTSSEDTVQREHPSSATALPNRRAGALRDVRRGDVLPVLVTVQRGRVRSGATGLASPHRSGPMRLMRWHTRRWSRHARWLAVRPGLRW